MGVCVSVLQYFTGIRRVVLPQTPVGVLELRVPATGVPFRVFYPAAAAGASHNPAAPWFAVARGESLHTFVRGYISCFPGHNAWPLWAHVLISWVCWLLTVCPLIWPPTPAKSPPLTGPTAPTFFLRHSAGGPSRFIKFPDLSLMLHPLLHRGNVPSLCTLTA